MADQLLPDPVDVVNAWWKTRPALTALTGKRVDTVLGSTMPAVRLTNLSPRARGPEESLARVQVECWSDDRDEANLIGRTVEAELPTLHGAYGGGWCAGAAVVIGPFDSPDPETERARSLLDLELWLYPSPPTST